MAEEIEKAPHFEGLRRVDEVREGGVVAVWFRLGVGFTENVVRVSHVLLQETRQETIERARDTFAWAEAFPKGGFRLIQLALEAGDLLGRDALARIERGALSAVGVVSRTGDDVREVTGRAVAQVVGSPRDSHTQAS